MAVLTVVVCAGLVVGLVANALFRHRVVKDDKDGPTPQTLLAPITTFAALFIAIVLSQSSASYNTAKTAAANEANVVDNMFEATEYITQRRFEIGLKASLVCYARAVRGPGGTRCRRGSTRPRRPPSRAPGPAPARTACG